MITNDLFVLFQFQFFIKLILKPPFVYPDKMSKGIKVTDPGKDLLKNGEFGMARGLALPGRPLLASSSLK